ncbi:CGNR zinc finger domain-containing protein [Flexivirga meconopsidis]|uniref:CGNR zinc finger domain-containing protein n=1 Tax=Flexivirga meconopsidis TaxID=2977121 RepID=UPI00223FD16D
MHINPYGEEPTLLAVALLNDRPATVRALQARCDAAGVVHRPGAKRADLVLLDRYLDEIDRLIDTAQASDRVRLLNELLARHTAHPRVTDHAGDGFHLHYRDAEMSYAAMLSALLTMGLTVHLVQRGMHRLARCAVPECETAFADTTKNGKQRYCSPACANRDAVRRHRSRHRASTPDVR